LFLLNLAATNSAIARYGATINVVMISSKVLRTERQLLQTFQRQVPQPRATSILNPIIYRQLPPNRKLPSGENTRRRPDKSSGFFPPVPHLTVRDWV